MKELRIFNQSSSGQYKVVVSDDETSSKAETSISEDDFKSICLFVEQLLLQQADVSGSAISAAKSELLKVAASLLTNQQSSFAEDWHFSNSTPKKDRRVVLQSCAAQNERLRLAAIKLKSIYDVLAKHCH